MKLRKLAAVLLGAAMVTGAIAGCGSKDKNTESPSNEKNQTTDGETQSMTLKVWAPQEDQTAFDGYEQGVIAYLCEQFNEAHPEWDIKFEYGVVSEGDASKEVLKDLDKAADVFMVANDQIADLVDAGAIARLGGDTMTSIEENVSEAMLGSVTYNDGVYAVPYTTNTYFMYYDTSLFTEDDVKSLDTMMEKDLGDGVSNFSFNMGNSWFVPMFYYAAGGELFGADGTDGSAGSTFGDHPEATAYMIDLYNNDKFHTEDDTNSGLAKFESGTLGAYVSGSWHADIVREYLGDNFGVTKLPTVTLDGKETQLMSFAGSKAAAVKSNSENLAAAIALAAYLGGEEAQTVRFETRGFTPTWASVEALSEVQANEVVAAEILQINEASKTQPLVAEMSNFWTPVESLGKGIVQGDVTMDNYVEATTLMGEGIND